MLEVSSFEFRVSSLEQGTCMTTTCSKLETRNSKLGPRVLVCMCSRIGWAGLLLLVAGCGARPTTIDAATGLPVAAQVRFLDGGRVLIEANGYETWLGVPDGPVVLVPLWQARFMTPAERRALPPPPAPCAGFPGSRQR
jgi:hypothetical protein